MALAIHIALGLILAVFLVRSFDAWVRVRAFRQVSDVLVPRSPELHADICAWHKHQHDTFDERHTVDWNPPMSRSDLINAALDKYDCAKRADAAGFGSGTGAEVASARAELRALQGDLLAQYRR